MCSHLDALFGLNDILIWFHDLETIFVDILQNFFKCCLDPKICFEFFQIVMGSAMK